MSHFYSFISVAGKLFIPKFAERQEMLAMDLIPDGHPSIIKYYQNKDCLSLGNNIEDKANKYMYNPYTKEFTISYLNGKDDSEYAKKVIMDVYFNEIEPRLVYKEFEDFSDMNIDQELLIFGDYKNYRDFVRDEVWSLLGGSVWNTLNDCVPYIGNSDLMDIKRLKYILTFMKGN